MKRLFLEISSGQGPEECELLVAKLMVRLTSELRREVRFREVALNGNREKSLVKSVLFELEGEGAAHHEYVPRPAGRAQAQPLRYVRHGDAVYFRKLRRRARDVRRAQPVSVVLQHGDKPRPGGERIQRRANILPQYIRVDIQI